METEWAEASHYVHSITANHTAFIRWILTPFTSHAWRQLMKISHVIITQNILADGIPLGWVSCVCVRERGCATFTVVIQCAHRAEYHSKTCLIVSSKMHPQKKLFSGAV